MTRGAKSRSGRAARHLIALLHGWIGVFASLFVFLIASTGLALAFFNEMFELQYGDIVIAESGPHIHVANIVEAAEANHPGGLEAIGLFMPDTRVEGLKTALVYGFTTEGADEHDVVMASIDPVTGAYKGSFDLENAVAHELNDFHFSLLMGEWGASFMAIIGILMAAFVLTGLYMWWPRGGTRKRDKLLKVQTKGRLVPKLFNWHGLAGIWLGTLTLLFTITGIGLSKPNWLGPALAQVDEPAVWETRFKQDCGDTVTLREAADQALAAFPGRTISSVDIVRGEETKYMFNLRERDDWNVRFGDVHAEVHARCAGEMWTTTLGEQNAPTIFGNLMLSLHGGHIFGRFAEASVILTGLALMLLSGSGVYVFFKRTLPGQLSRKNKRTQPRRERDAHALAE
ncbi:MAG: PepSY-associated TM helix domain-containing protein [Pseudomonadota bacterium]